MTVKKSGAFGRSADKTGTGWEIVSENPDWKIGFLSYGEKFSKFNMLERHNMTFEAFILLSGEAVLYTADKDLNVTSCQMERGSVYTVGKGEWHHITVSEDALVAVVENTDTAADNSETVTLA